MPRNRSGTPQSCSSYSSLRRSRTSMFMAEVVEVSATGEGAVYKYSLPY